MLHLRLAGRSALLLAVLALAGCDRFAADPEIGGGPPGPPGGAGTPVAGPAASVPALYLKGPAVALISDRTAYRSEAAPGAARYTWSLTGSTQATFEATERDATVISRAPGRAVLTVAAFDGNGKILGIGKRDITVDR